MLNGFHPVERTSAPEIFLRAKVKHLTGGLTQSTAGKEFTETHFKDSLANPNAHKGNLYAQGELRVRIEDLEKDRSRHGTMDLLKLKGMKAAEAKLKKTHESLKKLEPDTWYGKLGKSVKTALFGIRDSFMSFWNRHVDAEDSDTEAIKKLLWS